MSHVALDSTTTLAVRPLDDRAAWRALAADGGISGPFLDEPWASAWIDAFQPADPLMLGVWEGHDRLVAVAALQRLTERWAGRTISVVQSLTNVECARYEFLASPDRPDALARLWRYLCQQTGCDVIRLDVLPEGVATVAAAQEVARDLGWRWHLVPTFESPWRALAPPPAAWDEGLARKFKSNLRNRERRVAELGAVRFEVATGAALPAALQIYYDLDARSWKREAGTAVFQQDNVQTFYDRLVERAPEQIWIPILFVGDEPAAAQLLMVGGRTMFVQKTAYNPDLSPYTPGQLLTSRVVRHGIAHGMEALDFLAANMTWKSDWAPRLRPHAQLLLFAPSANGRYAYWTRYGWRQQVKRLLWRRSAAR